MQINRKTLAAGAVTATLAIGLVQAPGASADPAIAGTYNTTAITRVLDTRFGVGAPKATVAAGQALTVKVTGSLATASVSAVAMNVTVIAPTTAGSLTVYQGGSAGPQTSNINFTPKYNTPNSVVVATSSTGTVTFYNRSSGTLNLAADLYGYWTGGSVSSTTDGAFKTVTPARAFDSRVTGKALNPSRSGSVAVAGHYGVPATNVSAVVANITAVAPVAAGYFRVAAASTDTSTSTLINFRAGETRANLDTVPLNTDGSLSITNVSTGKTDYIVDVVGYFTGGTPQVDGAFTATTPYRTEDTRVDGSTIAANASLTVPVFPSDGTGALFKAVVVNLTAVSPTALGWLVPSSGLGTVPGTSASNFIAGQTVPNTVVVPVNPDGSIAIRNSSGGTVDVVVDVEGFVLNDQSGVTSTVAKIRVQKAMQKARAFSVKRLSR